MTDETWKFGRPEEQSIYTPVVLGGMTSSIVAHESPVTPSQSHLESPTKMDLQETKSVIPISSHKSLRVIIENKLHRSTVLIVC